MKYEEKQQYIRTLPIGMADKTKLFDIIREENLLIHALKCCGNCKYHITECRTILNDSGKLVCENYGSDNLSKEQREIWNQ